MVFADRGGTARVGHDQGGAVRPVLHINDAAGVVFADVVAGAGVNDEDLFVAAGDDVIAGATLAQGEVEAAVDVSDHADEVPRLSARRLVEHCLERFQGALGELRGHAYGTRFWRVIILPVRADSKMARLISAAR